VRGVDQWRHWETRNRHGACGGQDKVMKVASALDCDTKMVRLIQTDSVCRGSSRQRHRGRAGEFLYACGRADRRRPHVHNFFARRVMVNNQTEIKEFKRGSTALRQGGGPVNSFRPFHMLPRRPPVRDFLGARSARILGSRCGAGGGGISSFWNSSIVTGRQPARIFLRNWKNFFFGRWREQAASIAEGVGGSNLWSNSTGPVGQGEKNRREKSARLFF
jgi:hypothetical protein